MKLNKIIKFIFEIESYVRLIFLFSIILMLIGWIYYKPFYANRAIEINKIEVNMPIEKVEELIGEPDRIKASKINKETESWSYALSIPMPFVTSYKILIIKDSKVESIKLVDW